MHVFEHEQPHRGTQHARTHLDSEIRTASFVVLTHHMHEGRGQFLANLKHTLPKQSQRIVRTLHRRGVVISAGFLPLCAMSHSA